ncbi:MAG: MFS transporter [Bacteroidetes bacterium]|nr:MFS transporter [Bacteroidota bacterium]
MKTIHENHQGLSTILAFALIPISGFATDIYIPSLPTMAVQLGVSNAAVQLSILLFMVSYGLSQLVVGSILDSYGRFRMGSAALLAFSLSSFAIALTTNLYMIYAMRILQGIAVAFIVVGKRAYFIDVYKGDKLKHYTSLFSIVWASAPILAPFLGGYFQESWGWQSNFYFLGILSFVILVLEQIYSGESIKIKQPFHFKSIMGVYSKMIKASDFGYALVIIALCYSMLVVFGTTSPFLIEHVFHFSPVVSGYSALLSGVALMTGGIISKSLLSRPLDKKIQTAVSLQIIFALIMIGVNRMCSNIYTLMAFVILIHLLAGFIFNNLFAYALGRFTQNAGVASGVVGGGNYVFTSLFTYSITGFFKISNSVLLGLVYLVLALLLLGTFLLFKKSRVEKKTIKAFA